MNTPYPILSLFFLALAIPSWAALNVPVTVQEALYDDLSGVARTDEPFCSGIPIPDSAGITNTDRFGLTGASSAQFRILGRWPSGNVKWVKVCGIIPSLAAGGSTSVTLTDNGSGNFPGGSLAADNGATISVNTGAAVFTIKKAHFNVIDSVVVGGTTVISSSSSDARGLILTGPDPAASFPANVTCGNGPGQSPCDTQYSSANDPNSSCVIEENGPVMAVLRCIGNHADRNGNVYMHYTARVYLYRNKTGVKVTTVLRNANYNTSAAPSPDCNSNGSYCQGKTYNTAYKGMRSYELRISPNVSGPLNYTIAGHGTNKTGTISGSDYAYVYQGQSSWMIPHGVEGLLCNVGSNCANNYTPDRGYRLNVNGSDVLTGTNTQYPAGWVAVSNGSGAGMQVGMYQFAAQWPASLELLAGGTDVRIGLISGRNTGDYYQQWPEWRIHDSYLNFYASSPASLSNEFLKFQHFLLGRANRTHYNASRVFPFPIVDPAIEDKFYVDTYNAATPKTFGVNGGSATLSLGKYCWREDTTSCSGPDRGTGSFLQSNALTLGVYRGGYEWQSGGGLNQTEFRLSDLWKWLQRGYTGRYLNSGHFYKYIAEKGFAHSDGTTRSDSTVNGFNWRSRPYFGAPGVDELDGFVQPAIWSGGDGGNTKITNFRYMGSMSIHKNVSHMHYWGIFFYYFMSGDETVRDSFHMIKDIYLGQSGNYSWKGRTPGQGNGYSPRAEATYMQSATMFADYLQAAGDPDAPAVLAAADQVWTKAFKPDPCVSGYPKGCAAPILSGTRDDDPAGVSRVRGMLTSNGGRGASNCNAGAGYRITQPLQQAIAAEALLVYMRHKGRNWADYRLAEDLLFGISQWALRENYKYDGQPHWWVGGGVNGTNTFWGLYNGFTSWTLTDVSQVCPEGTPVPGGQVGEPTAQFAGVGVMDTRAVPQAHGDVWMHFYANWLITGRTDWADKARIAFIRHNARGSVWPGNWGSYRLALITDVLNNPGNVTLQDVPFSVTAVGGGVYRLTFTPPAGSTSLRIKWSQKRIAPSDALLGFDLTSQRFALDPDTYVNWFAANDATEPVPTPGAPQSVDVTTSGVSGLLAANFSVKAYAPSGADAGDTTLPVISSFSVAPDSVTQGGSSTVSWSVSGASSVSIDQGIGVVSDTGSKTVSPTATTTYILTASNASGSATATATLTVSAAADSQAPDIPTGLSATAVSDSRIDLAWSASNDNVGVAGYRIYRGETEIGTTVSPAYSDTGLAPSTAYSYTVTAYDAAGNMSGHSGMTSATTREAETPGGSTITWQCIAGHSANGCPAPNAAWPRYTGFSTARTDPASGQVLFYVSRPNGNGIYSTDIQAFNPSNNTFTLIPGGTGSPHNTCPQDGPAWPADRHPESLTAVDTKRNVMWLFGGVNQSCSGSTVSVTSGSTTVTRISGNSFHTGLINSWNGLPIKINGVSYTVASVTDSGKLELTTPASATLSSAALTLNQYGPYGLTSMYYLSLNPNPSDNTMTKVNPAPGIPGTVTNSAAAVYSPDDDVIVAYRSEGITKTIAVYCPTISAENPGALTPAQTAAGCTAADQWAEVRLNAGIVNASGTQVTLVSGTEFDTDGSWAGKAIVLTDPRTGSAVRFTIAAVADATHLTLTSSAGTRNGHQYGLRPTADKWVGLVYDTANKKVILFQGTNNAGTKYFNETWSYDIAAKRFELKCRGACTPPPAYSNSNTGIPAIVYSDALGKVLYHQTTGPNAPADWAYDFATDAWTLLQNNVGPGSPAGIDLTMGMSGHKIVTMTKFSGVTEVWVGTVNTSGSGTPVSECDVNSDGRVDSLDVQLTINQALGKSACQTGDVKRDRSCNVIDVQTVINAVRGSGCRTTE